MKAMEGLGAVLNVIHEASGVDVPLTQAGAVTFVSFLADGSQTMVFTQTDSTGTNSEIDLDIFATGSSTRIFAGPGVGGTWTNVTASAADDNTADGADSTNDTMVVTVLAEQLADGYDSVQCTSATGTVVAILHDLKVMRSPSNLKSSIVA